MCERIWLYFCTVTDAHLGSFFLISNVLPCNSVRVFFRKIRHFFDCFMGCEGIRDEPEAPFPLFLQLPVLAQKG